MREEMMRKVFGVLCCLLIALPLAAQQRTGNIYGTVMDDQGTPLPGVSVTLTGVTIAPMATTTSSEGRFRFLSLFPANDYVLKAELAGFKTKIETGVIVNIGRNSDIMVVMEPGVLEEQVTVIAQTPMVDAKKTQVTHTVNYEMLQSLPSARDPWVILQMTPGIMMDRENIGGAESGQQSAFQSRGSTGQEWTIDGMQTTDRNSGGSPGYYDFDAFEELNISTGSLDVEHRDPGVVINIVTRRGGNKLSLGGRFYYSDKYMQGTVPQEKLNELNIRGFNQIRDIKDFGFNAGGPIVKDKAWWWGSYGVQQIQTINAINVNDDTYLNNYNFKVNLQLLPQNRFEFLYMIGDKTKFGRSSAEYYPPGWRQGSRFKYGNPSFKFQDEHMFGDKLFASIRIGKSDAGFGMIPESDLDLKDLSWYDVEQNLYYGSQTYFYSDRPHPYGVIQAQYFNDSLFGAAHEMKVGFEVNNNSRTYVGGYPGNVYIQRNYYQDIVDWDGDGVMDNPRDDFGIDLRRIYNYRSYNGYRDGTKRIAAYFSDTVSKGRFNINLGVRFDRGKPYVEETTSRSLWTADQMGEIYNQYQKNYADIALLLYTPETIDKVRALLPERQRDYVEAQKLYTMFSPRLGLTYDIFGNGKTLLKLAYTLYPGGFLGTGYWTPAGMGGAINFWWHDANGDGTAHWNELYWANYGVSTRPVYRAFDDDGNFVGNYTREYGLMYSGFIWGATDLTRPSAYVDLDTWKTSQTHEFQVSVDREIMRDFGVQLSYTRKRMGRYSSSYSYYPEEFFPGLDNHYRTTDDYEIGGYIPDQLIDLGPDRTLGTADDVTYDPGEAAGRPWYVLKNIPETATTSYSILKMMDPKRHNVYQGVDLVFTKRLSHKWMMNGSLTYQTQKSYYGDYGYTDPTNIWAYEGQIYGFSMGGTSGKISQTMFTRWMVKLMGLYQLPYDISISGTLTGREGAFNTVSFGVQNRTLPNPRSYSNSMLNLPYGKTERLPPAWTVNLKLEKMFRLGDTSRMYFSVDCFNVFNNDVVLRRYSRSYGTFRFIGAPGSETWYTAGRNWTAPSATQGRYNELMNPLTFRLGMRFQI
jgi:hypothetical protein